MNYVKALRNWTPHSLDSTVYRERSKQYGLPGRETEELIVRMQIHPPKANERHQVVDSISEPFMI